MRKTTHSGRSNQAHRGRRGGVSWWLAIPGSHPRRARGGVLLRGGADRRPVGADGLALRWEVSTFWEEVSKRKVGSVDWRCREVALLLRSKWDLTCRRAFQSSNPKLDQHWQSSNQSLLYRNYKCSTYLCYPQNNKIFLLCSHSDVNGWTIQLGITRRRSHAYYGQKVKVRRVVPHPLYNIGVAHDNDIALFQVSCCKDTKPWLPLRLSWSKMTGTILRWQGSLMICGLVPTLL